MCKPWKANDCKANTGWYGDYSQYRASEQRKLQKDRYDTENYGY